MRNYFKTPLDKSIVKIGQDVSKMSYQEWQAYRESLSSVGGSEIGAILGFDKYTSNVEMFYKKLGLFQKTWDYRLAPALGNHFEAKIVELMRYYDADEQQFAKNIDNKTVTMRTRVYKKTLFPLEFSGKAHLNLDAFINIPDRKGFGVLEVKRSSTFALDMHINRLNPSYLAQAIFYAGALGLPYSVLCVVADNAVEVFIIDSSPEQYEAFKPTVIDFIQRLSEARKILANLPIDADESIKYASVAHLEPEPFDEQGAPYLQFLTERAKFIENETPLEGDVLDFEQAVAYMKIASSIKGLEDEKVSIKNYFLKRFLEADTTKIQIDGLGSVTNRKGLRFNLKEK